MDTRLSYSKLKKKAATSEKVALTEDNRNYYKYPQRAFVCHQLSKVSLLMVAPKTIATFATKSLGSLMGAVKEDNIYVQENKNKM